jgi:hypothetical protein
MKEFNAEEVRFETVSAVDAMRRAPAFARYPGLHWTGCTQGDDCGVDSPSRP